MKQLASFAKLEGNFKMMQFLILGGETKNTQRKQTRVKYIPVMLLL